MARSHEPVLLAETLAMLAVRPAGLYVDGKVGLGGHAAAISTPGARRARILGFDRDAETLERNRERFELRRSRAAGPRRFPRSARAAATSARTASC